ncbi:MAG: queuosine precursor transporter [Thermomicrobiales bacterium]|nr:queuosine precursor transporter [Thermomicrobiales bacterium]
MSAAPVPREEDTPAELGPFRFVDVITASFVAVLLLSNIGSTKIVTAGPFQFDGGTILFPLSYIFGDILTEVYGFRRSRRVIWIGFFWMIVAAAFLALIDVLPPAPGFELAESFHLVLGQAPRIVTGSLLAFWCGEFANSIVLARLKVVTGGRWLWVRTIGSTLIGQAIDTAVFLTVAFLGVLPRELLIAVWISNYVFKVGIEVVLTPVTYAVVDGLKRAEDIDMYDTRTSFNPFHWSGS